MIYLLQALFNVGGRVLLVGDFYPPLHPFSGFLGVCTKRNLFYITCRVSVPTLNLFLKVGVVKQFPMAFGLHYKTESVH